MPFGCVEVFDLPSLILTSLSFSKLSSLFFLSLPGALLRQRVPRPDFLEPRVEPAVAHRDLDRLLLLRFFFRGGGGGGGHSVGERRSARRAAHLRQRAVDDDLRGPLFGGPLQDRVERCGSLGPGGAELVRGGVDRVLDGMGSLGLSGFF